ncbi:hypothetical protein LJC68_04605, partial [Bacteroidales bacterium OttesenSCG-928-B11]|nr:hypothetical protein [Bacteroidales bacterium OttesenSCG-928-B11]
FQSVYIRAASIAAVVMLLLNVWRASFIRHPFIANETWRFKVVYLTCFAYLVIDLLIAPSHLLEHIYMEATLGYDVLHAISLNWVVLAGIAIGSIFTYKTFAQRKWAYKTMNLIALSSIVIYLLISYFSIDYNVSKSSLILPLFLRGFGYAIISICFLTILSRIPFQNFFQSLSVQAFFSAGIGGVLGTAILGRALKITMKRNSMLPGAQLDHVNPLAVQLPPGELYGTLQQQALIVSMKELYGWLVIIGIFCILILMIKESDLRPKHALHPTYRAIRRRIKRELKLTRE